MCLPDGARRRPGSGRRRPPGARPRQDREVTERHGPPSLTLYETAYLTGGPHRLADVALVSMAQQDRLLLAHTGWATVVDPVGRDAVERATLTAIGPDGQRPIPAVRGALDGSDAVRALAGRLVTAGLAQPEAARRDVGHSVRQLRWATVVVLLTAAAALWMTPSGRAAGPMLAWFALPLVSPRVPGRSPGWTSTVHPLGHRGGRASGAAGRGRRRPCRAVRRPRRTRRHRTGRRNR